MLHELCKKLNCCAKDEADNEERPPDPVSLDHEAGSQDPVTAASTTQLRSNAPLSNSPSSSSSSSSPSSLDQSSSNPALSNPSSSTPSSSSSSSHPESIEPSRKNLWILAQERLSTENQKSLNLDNHCDIEVVIQDVRNKTEAKYKEYKEGGLRIRRRDKEDISIREIAKKLLNSILQAQELIKTVVSFDATGHASIAWNIVSVGLNLVKNDFDRRDAVMEASAFLAGVLSYSAIVDHNYRNLSVESDENLDNSLVDIYAAILQYTAEVNRAIQEGPAVRVWKSVTSLVDKPLQQLQDTIAKQDDDLKKWRSLSSDLDQKQQAETILARIDQMTNRLQTIDTRAERTQELEILDWLSQSTYSETQNSIQKRRTSQTGDWFLGLDTYHGWKNNPGEILWLHGVVGCGKSVLCSTVIADIEKFHETDSKKVAYWYFQFNNEKTQRVYTMIRSIIRQLCPSPLPGSIIELWDAHRQGREPTQDQVCSILDEIIEYHQSHTFLIFDALDECPQQPGDHERDSLLHFLCGFIERHQRKLHILATSRPEPDIRSQLENHQCFDIEEGLSEDVDIFVHDELRRGNLAIWGTPVKREIEKQLLDIPKRRFRWADLQIKRLEGCHTEDDIYQALSTVPKDLPDTYRMILGTLKKRYRQAARSILIWLTFSMQPLTLDFVANVVSFPFPKSVIEICTTSLVTVSSNSIISLAHFSVKEFLVSDDSEESWYHFSTVVGHATIANMALSFILDIDEKIPYYTSQEGTLLMYAAKNWDAHFEEVKAASLRFPELQKRVDRIFCEPVPYWNWRTIASTDYYSQPPFEPPINMASRMGLKRTVEALLVKGTDSLGLFSGHGPRFTTRIFYQDALTAAAVEGHFDILELLLRANPVISINIGFSITRFLYYRGQGREKLKLILGMLWKKGRFFKNSEPENIIYEKLAVAAAGNETSALIIMEILLDWKDREAVPITGEVLANAICNDHSGGIMEIFFRKRDTDVHVTESVEWRLPQCSPYHPDGVKLVLKNRAAEISVASVKRFARYSSPEVMQLLLEIRDDIYITKEILESAASNECAGTIRVLLEQSRPGENISKETLINAAQNWDAGVEILNFLLDECGPDVLMGEGVTQAVASNPFCGCDMIKTLVQRQQAGLMISAGVLLSAAKYHGREIFELLVNNGGSSIPITEEILCAAAANLKYAPPLIQYLFDLQEDPFNISEDVLISACRNHSKGDEIFPLLLDRYKAGSVSDKLFVGACGSKRKISLLLERFPDQLPTKTIVKTSVQHCENEDALHFLLDRQLLVIDEWVVDNFAGNPRGLKIIFQRKPDSPITPRALDTVAREGVQAVLQLLDSRSMRFEITGDFMKALLESLDSPCYIIQLLFVQLRSRFPITEDIVTQAAFAVYRDTEPLKILLTQPHEVNLYRLWERVWQSESDLSRKVKTFMALLQHVTLELSEDMLESIDSRPRGFTCFLDRLISLCARKHIQLPATERALEIIAQRCSEAETLRLFLKCNPEIPITEKHFEAGEQNLHNCRKVIRAILLAKKDAL